MITAIVQARMGSSRLPGKVLLPIANRPLIDVLLFRLRKTSLIDQVVVATSTSEKDDPLEEFCIRNGVLIYRGSENDVLDRFHGAALKFGGDHLVRITGDCPLISHKICNEVINFYLNGNYNYVNTGPKIAEGLDCEVLSCTTLETIWRQATDPIERLHVTLYIHRHPELFKKASFETAYDDSLYRITVDEPRDFELITRISEFFGDRIIECEWDEVRSWLNANPDAQVINQDITRNEGLQLDIAKMATDLKKGN